MQILKQAEIRAAELSCEHGMGITIFYKWHSKHKGVDRAADIADESDGGGERVHQDVCGSDMQNDLLKDVLKK